MHYFPIVNGPAASSVVVFVVVAVVSYTFIEVLYNPQ